MCNADYEELADFVHQIAAGELDPIDDDGFGAISGWCSCDAASDDLTPCEDGAGCECASPIEV